MTDKLREFIVRDLRWQGPAEALTDDYPLIDNEVVDSMGIFQTVGFLEDSYGIEIDDEDLVPENFATIGAISRLVAAKRAL